MLDPVRHESRPPENDDGLRQSLSEVYASVHVPAGGQWIRRFLAFAGRAT